MIDITGNDASAADWQSYPGLHTAPASNILGLYSTSAAGNPFDNNMAAAGGVIGIYMDGGEFLVYVFETNSLASGNASILANYVWGAKLFVSPFGLLTTQQPSTFASITSSAVVIGYDTVVATVTKEPTSTDLSLGIRWLATPLPLAPATIASV